MTFDDGPDETWTIRILEELERHDVRATFFLIGERIRTAPRVARAVADAGHEIGLHCDRHVRHTDLSEHEIESDTGTALATLADLGLRPARWRTPWGICTPATVGVAERNGLELTHWTVDTHDWRGDSVSQMLDCAAAGVAGGGVILMHDALGPGARREGCENTVALLAPLIAMVQARGLGLGFPPLPHVYGDPAHKHDPSYERDPSHEQDPSHDISPCTMAQAMRGT